jgi:hypothetical protein
VIDPRTPELEAWIEALPSAWKQAVAVRALCLAYPFLKACAEWQEKIAVLEGAMHLRPHERTELVLAAAAAAKGLKAAMSRHWDVTYSKRQPKLAV